MGSSGIPNGHFNNDQGFHTGIFIPSPFVVASSLECCSQLKKSGSIKIFFRPFGVFQKRNQGLSVHRSGFPDKFVVISSLKRETALKIALSIVGPLWGCKLVLKDAFFTFQWMGFFNSVWPSWWMTKFCFPIYSFGLVGGSLGSGVVETFTRIIRLVKTYLQKVFQSLFFPGRFSFLFFFVFF